MTTSRPLTEDQRGRLQQQLNTLYGKDLKLTVDVDPALLGGLKVQVGEEVIDGSVAARLDDEGLLAEGVERLLDAEHLGAS